MQVSIKARRKSALVITLHVTRSILSYKSRLSLDSIVRQMRLARKSRYEEAEQHLHTAGL